MTEKRPTETSQQTQRKYTVTEATKKEQKTTTIKTCTACDPEEEGSDVGGTVFDQKRGWTCWTKAPWKKKKKKKNIHLQIEQNKAGYPEEVP